MDSYNGIIILEAPIEQKSLKSRRRPGVFLLTTTTALVLGTVALLSTASGGSSYLMASPGRGLRQLATLQQWSGWFSDDLNSGRDIHRRGVDTYFQLGRGDGVISGIRCRNNYCDDMQARFELPERSPGSQVSAFWLSSRGDLLSEEDGGEYQCPTNHFVSGLHCYGSFCDNLDIRCSQFSNRPRGFCYWTNGWFSEEQGEITFREGYYLAGMRCNGSYCDNKQFYVCTDSETETSVPGNPDDCSELADTDSAVVTGFECTTYPCNEAEHYKLTCAVPGYFGRTADSIVRVDDIDSRGFINCPDGHLVKSVEEEGGRPTLVCARFNTRNAALFRQSTCKFYDEEVGTSSESGFRAGFGLKSLDFEPGFYLSGFQCTAFGGVGNPRNCRTRRFRVCPLN